jgi:hypothetical protein
MEAAPLLIEGLYGLRLSQVQFNAAPDGLRLVILALYEHLRIDVWGRRIEVEVIVLTRDPMDSTSGEPFRNHVQRQLQADDGVEGRLVFVKKGRELFCLLKRTGIAIEHEIIEVPTFNRVFHQRAYEGKR